MALPVVNGWLIDFRTARSIFDTGNNVRIVHCVDFCSKNTLYICHCEEDEFKSHPTLGVVFLKDQSCVLEPDDDIFERCIVINQNPNGKAKLVGNEAAIYLTASALSKGYGVISDHRSVAFATVYDMCRTYGVPVYSANEYFSLLG